MSERTSNKQKPMPSMLKSIQRSATVASAAVDNFAASSSTTSAGVGQRERQSLLGNDTLADHSNGVGGGGGGGGAGGSSPTRPTSNPTTKAPKAPPGLKMSGRHQKMKAVMDNISRRLKVQTRGSNLGFRGRDMHDATGKRYRVEVPKNMLAYVACVFFVLPLVLGLYILLRQVLYGDDVHSRYTGAHHDLHKDPLHGHHGDIAGAGQNVGGNVTVPGHELGLKAEGDLEKTAEENDIVVPPKEDEGSAAAEGAASAKDPGGDQEEVAADADAKKDKGDTENSKKVLGERAEKRGGTDKDGDEANAGTSGATKEDETTAKGTTADAKTADGKTDGEGKEGGVKTYDEEVREEIAEDAKDKEGKDAVSEEGKKEDESGVGTIIKDNAKSEVEDESAKADKGAEEKKNTARRRR